MGCFSWNTADTNESIPLVDVDDPDHMPRTVYLLQPTGFNIEEKEYEGYGMFGNANAYAWLSYMNIPWEQKINKTNDELISLGIDLFFSEEYSSITHPLKFSFDKDAKYDALPASTSCDFQGCMYEEDTRDTRGW